MCIRDRNKAKQTVGTIFVKLFETGSNIVPATSQKIATNNIA